LFDTLKKSITTNMKREGYKKKKIFIEKSNKTSNIKNFSKTIAGPIFLKLGLIQ